MEKTTDYKTERKKHTFEIFKGQEDQSGKVTSKSRMGRATLYEGASTYNLYISTFMSEESKIVFHMLPDNDPNRPYDFVLLTRQKSIRSERKYHWQKVGQAYKYDNQGESIIRLDWDFFQTENIFMNLTPLEDTVQQPAPLSVA